MPSVPSISFNVRYDLTSAPTLVLTDATTYPVGAIGIFTITQPDGYVRTGNFSSPDISSSGGTLSTALRLSSTGGVQCGTYIIKYEIRTTDLVISTFTREFVFTYVPVELNLKENFDVFTPSLSYSDMTSYGVNNYSNITPTRSWTAVSIPTGTKTSNTSTISLQHNGNYYDAVYTITLASTLTYQHTTYSWLSVLETVSKTVVAEACTPEPLEDIVAMMETLRQNSINCAGDLPIFEKAQSLFSHLMDQVKMAILNNIPQDGIYDTYEDLMAILRNGQPCVHTNLPIDPYDLGDYAVSPFPIDLSYCALIGDGYNTTYTVNHKLNDNCVIVQVYESATGAQVLCDVTVSDNNNVVASFYTAPTSNQYKVVVYAGARGQVGPGVAAGGTTGQYLRKTSATDFATYWDTLDAADIPVLDMSKITTGNLDWSRLTSTPTTLAGYGITDPVVLTSGSYANPVWLTSLAWSKITGAPTFLTTETDPVFTAHPAFGITGTKISNWDAAYSWVNAFPSQSGNTGKFLTTNGSVLSWADVVTSNIYTADGTLGADRTITSNGKLLTVLGGKDLGFSEERSMLIQSSNNSRSTVGIAISNTATNGKIWELRSASDATFRIYNATSTAQRFVLSDTSLLTPALVYGNGNSFNLGYDTGLLFSGLWFGATSAASVNVTGNSTQTTINANGDIYFTKGLYTNTGRIFGSTGNWLIQTGGTFTDAGYKLDVKGTARVSGQITSPSLISSSSLVLGENGTARYTITENEIFRNAGGGWLIAQFLGGAGLGTYGLSVTTNLTQLGAASNLLLSVHGVNQNVSIDSPGFAVATNASALLQVNSTTRGFLPPRMTSTQKSAISTPATGLVIYQTDSTEGLYQYKSTGWEAIGGGGTPAGSNTQIQYNNSGAFGASSGFVYDDSIGAMTLSKNQNTETTLLVKNVNTGTAGNAKVEVQNSLSAVFSISKLSTGFTTYKTLVAGDGLIYNGLGGDITILNDFGTGKIKFGAGGSSTAQMTLTAAGRLLLGTTTEGTYLLDVNGTARVSGQTTLTGSVTASSALAQGIIATPTLVAAANNDVLVGLNIAPTFTNGAFTGVTNIGLRLNGNINFNNSSGSGLYNSNNTSNIFFGHLNITNTATTSIGGYFETYGNNFGDATLRGGVQYIYDTRNSGAGGFQITRYDGSSYQSALKVFASTNIGINSTTDAGYKLDVNGTARVSGGVTFTGGKLAPSAGIAISIDNETAIRGTTAGALMYIDGGSDLNGTISLRASGVTASNNFSAVGITGTNITCNGGILLSQSSVIATSRLSNTTSGRIWYFETHRNAVSGSLEITKDISTPCITAFSSNSVAIGSFTETTSAVLSVTSTTKGFLPPRMTATQLAAISSPAVGLVAYQTDGTEGLYQYKSTGWVLVGGTGGGSGTVTTVSVATANGFAGTVANATTTPAITLSTTVTGLLKGNGTAISAATAGTDYLTPTDIEYSVANVTTTYSETATKGTKIIKCDTTGGAFTVTLPTAVGNKALLIIKKVAGSGALTIDGNSSETIDGGLTATINKVYESITLISDNSNWQIV